MLIEKVLVSVIVPIYNVENYLEKCLEQLAGQTLKEIEVIMVDDGSTDASFKIARRYEERYENFRLIRKNNGGLSSARNCGIEYALGKYLYFCDSDDYILYDTLELLVRKAEKEHLDVIKFCAYEFDDLDENLRNRSYVYNGEYEGVKSGKQLLKEMYKNGDNIPSACLALIKSSIIKENNIYFIDGIIHEDNFFNFQIMFLSQKVLIWKKELYCRRHRDGSITQNIDYYKSFKGYARTAVEIDKLARTERVYADINWIKKYVLMYILSSLAQFEKIEDLSSHVIDRELLQNIKTIIVKNFFWLNNRILIFTISIRLYWLIGRLRRKIENGIT